MAINYPNLFAGLGEFVQRANRYNGFYSGFDTDISEIESELNAIGRSEIFSGVPEIFNSFRSDVLGWISRINEKGRALLVERESVLEQLNLTSDDLNTVLRTVYRQMVIDGQTVQRSTVTIGAINATKDNANAGGVTVDKVLDGVVSPGNGLIENWEYAGANSEMARSEQMFVQVTSDSESDGLTEGNESLQIFGQVSSNSEYSHLNYGSGAGPVLTPIQGGSIGVNMEMETFTDDLPDGWAIASGTAGSHTFEETVTIHRGVASLKMVGAGGQSEITLTQNVPTNAQPNGKYCVGFWIKGNSSLTQGTLTIQFEGAGYTAGASEKISLDASALAAMTSFAWQHFYVVLPKEIPSDMKLVIRFSGTPTNGHAIYIDGGGMIAPTWHNGVSFVAYAGSEPFIRGDRFVLNIANDEAGVFQGWFRRALGFQLPSANVPSISDSYAT